MNILLTSVGTATSIGVIKNIRKYRANWNIVGVDINDYGYTAGSLLADKFYRVSLASDKKYQDEIIRIINKESIDYFWPINDVEIRKTREWNELSCDCIIPSEEILSLVGDKLQCTRKLMQLEIDCPEIVDMTYKGKCIIRDRIGVGSKGIKITENIGKEDISQDVFVQKYITGTEYTVDILCDRLGKPLYIIPRARLEVKSGVATKARIENLPVLIDTVKQILKEVCLPGFSNMQFIRSSDGTYFFIEINPRIGGYSSASLLAAPEMFAAFLEMLDGEEKNNIRSFNQNIHWNTVVTRYYEEALYDLSK